MLAKDYGFLFAPRDILFGLIRINQWGYGWGYPSAFIDLLCIDTTIIYYPQDGEISKEDVDDTIAEWNKKQEGKKKKTITVPLNN